jgi:hypothetical protein
MFVSALHKGNVKKHNKCAVGNFVCLGSYIHLLYSSAACNLEFCGLCLATIF